MNSPYFKTKAGTELPILDLRGKPYLQVAHRIVWFREERPEWIITTEFLKLEESFCICRAVVSDDQGKARSMAHKREDAKHFPDFMEKAETGAIGRALAYIGYGTQFCADELDEGERLADAPIPPVSRLPVKPRVASVSPQGDAIDAYQLPTPVPPCSGCGADLKRSSKDNGWFCPNWKDGALHDYVKDQKK